jgi:hypothetical protein
MPEEHDPDPTADRPDSGDRDRDVWTGRAGVRPSGAVPRDPYDQEGDWADPGQTEPAGHWWTPIAVGSVSLVLLALLGFGIMVIVQSSGDDTETPGDTPTAAQLPAETGAGVTTPAVAATTLPTTDAADPEVNVPALRGMPLADAQAALERSGLGWRILRRESDAEPDTVIDCDPAEGQQVPSDTRVTLIVASARAGTPTTSAPVSTTPSNGATR